MECILACSIHKRSDRSARLTVYRGVGYSWGWSKRTSLKERVALNYKSMKEKIPTI